MRGLVLEGGGAKGAYQIGAWEAFRYLGIEFDAVTGTSVGALNGALYVQGDYEKAYDLWYNLRPEQVIQGDAKAIEKLSTLEIGKGDLDPIARYVASVFATGGLDISPLKQMLDTLLNESRIRASKVDFGIVTVSLTDFKPLEMFINEIPVGQLSEYLLASANLPVFKLNRLDGKLYIDGGFYDNLPINLMSSKGIREIVAVELGSLGIRQPVKRDDLSITWITPSEDIGRLLEFNPDKIRRNMKLGYFDTLRAYKDYRGSIYFLEGDLGPGWGMENLLKLTEQDIIPIRNWMDAEDMEPRRFLFEMLIPLLSELLETPVSANYDDLLLRYFEVIARMNKVDRLQIMDVNGFVQSIGQIYENLPCAVPGSFVESVARHLRQNSMYLKTQRGDFLPWVFQYFIQGFRNH